jgi:hypothetical protein
LFPCRFEIQVPVEWGSKVVNLTSTVEAVLVSDRMTDTAAAVTVSDRNTSHPGVVITAIHCTLAVHESGRVQISLDIQAQDALAHYLPLEAASSGQRRRLKWLNRSPTVSAFSDPWGFSWLTSKLGSVRLAHWAVTWPLPPHS